MPRPGYAAGRGTAAGKSGNPIKAWKEKREEKKREALDEAARMISNKTAENENLMIDTLAGIDFLHSRLPKEVLEHKTNEAQPCGDLEYASMSIRRLISRNPQATKMDIRKLDTKLLALALLFKEAVEQGDAQAAYAAKAGLIRGVNDIRNRIPQNQPELSGAFVDQNAEYLDGWITLVGTAKSIDMQERNLVVERRELENKRQDVRGAQEQFHSMIQSRDSEEALAYYQILDNDLPEERLKWNDTQRKVHSEIVQLALDKNVLDVRTIKLSQSEMQMSAAKATQEMMFTSVSDVPVVVDPNLMNKQKEAIDGMMKKLAATDVMIDETLRSMDELEGKLAQLDSAPGTVRAREVAAEEAEKLAKELEKEQELQTGGVAKELAERRKAHQIFSEEEQAERVKAFEEAQQQIMDEVYAVEEESEANYNYN